MSSSSACFCFSLLVFVVYLLTLCPSIVGGDSGHLVVVADQLGVAHPPGYPLFTLLGHLFSKIPLGSVAWRVNLLSAVASSLASLFLALGVARWSGRNWVGLLAAGLFAFSPLTWRYSVVAEVFALNNFFAACLLFLSISFHQRPTKAKILWGAVIFGLGMANHHTLVFFGLPIFLWSLAHIQPNKLRIQFASLAVLLSIGGLVPYAYLPIAAKSITLVTWGDTGSWQGFWTHFFRQEYGTFQLGLKQSEGLFVSYTLMYLKHLVTQFLYVGPLLALFFFVRPWQKADFKGPVGLTILVFLFYYISFHSLARMPIDAPVMKEVLRRFWQAPNMIISLWIALGLWRIRQWVGQSHEKVFVGAAALMVITQLVSNFAKEDRSGHYAFEKFGKVLLNSLPQNSLLIMNGDSYHSVLRYLQLVLNFRTDVITMHQGLLHYPWIKRMYESNYDEITIPGPYYFPERKPGYDYHDLIQANKHRPIFLSALDKYEYQRNKKGLTKNYELIPWGSLFKVQQKSTAFDISKFLLDSDRLNESFFISELGEYSPESWEGDLFREMQAISLRRALYIRGLAKKTNAPEKLLRISATSLEEAIKNKRAKPVDAYMHLGYTYRQLSKFDPTALQKMNEVWRRYLQLTDKNTPERIKIEKLISQAKPVNNP